MLRYMHLLAGRITLLRTCRHFNYWIEGIHFLFFDLTLLRPFVGEGRFNFGEPEADADAEFCCIIVAMLVSIVREAHLTCKGAAALRIETLSHTLLLLVAGPRYEPVYI